MRHPAERLGIRAALGFYLAALLWLTLGVLPGLGSGAGCNLEPGRTIGVFLSIGGFLFVWNVLGNIVAFVPLGLALRAGVVGPPWRLRWVLAAGAGLSLLIEVLQYHGGQRVADVDDVILNAVGTLSGAVLWDLVALVAAAVGRERGVAANARVG